MITRKQYMRGEVSHDEYYGQFDSPSVRQWIKSRIGIERLKKSNDPHFNDIHLSVWDRYHPICLLDGTARKIGEANGSGGISLSDAVCTAKCIARKMLNETNQP